MYIPTHLYEMLRICEKDTNIMMVRNSEVVSHEFNVDGFRTNGNFT
jgi:hypothetical protein